MSNPFPIRVASLAGRVTQIAVGGAHVCAVDRSSALWCWGNDTVGELGIGKPNWPSQLLPVNVKALGSSVERVAAGHLATCAVTLEQSLWCWGENSSGEIGDGTTIQRSTPVRVDVDGRKIIDVGTGPHSCALDADGRVHCWGRSYEGEIGSGTPSLKCGPSTWCEPSPRAVTGLPLRAIQLAVGTIHTCALLEDRSVWCWGDDESGELGDGKAVGPCNVATKHCSISPLHVSSLARTVASIAAGAHHTCAVTTDGALWCWGGNYLGQLGDGTTIDRAVPVKVLHDGVTSVTTGAEHTCAIRHDRIWCWGLNLDGEIGDGTTNYEGGSNFEPLPSETKLSCP